MKPHVKLGPVATTRQGKRLVTICVELASPHEFMTITVSVPHSDKVQNVCDQGVARAQDLAKDFSNLPLHVFPLNEIRRAGLIQMPLTPEQEILCERVEKGEPSPSAAALIRHQEIDALWDRHSHAYALVGQ